MRELVLSTHKEKPYRTNLHDLKERKTKAEPLFCEKFDFVICW